MAATHIKFALDVQSELSITDVQTYTSGAVYPDSRYASGIAREDTHGDFVFEKDFLTSDFNKGWMTHIRCDHVGDRVMNELFSDQLDGLRVGTDTHQQWWHVVSALKVLLDMHICSLFDLQLYLPLTITQAPRNESSEILERYYELLNHMYTDKSEITIDDFKEIWLGVGLEPSITAPIVDKIVEFQKNDSIVEKIPTLYTNMVQKGL